MGDQNPVSFAELLRQLRLERGLTQEGLAEAAGLSVRSISDLERGINQTARRETARLLADSLRLAGEVRAIFEACARGRRAPSAIDLVSDTIAIATRTLPRDNANFTGRQAELRRLIERVTSEDSGSIVQICAIGGMAGVGKTAFAVHAAHRLASRFALGQIFLPLHGHTPGQRPVAPADALESLLLTSGVTADQIPPDLESRARLWRDHLAKRKLLLVLDDAVGHEQIAPLLPGAGGNLVLVTTRRHLTSLHDAHTISLDILPPDEAAELFCLLADRDALDRADPAVNAITRTCGFLPLAIGMLARQLHHHSAWQCAQLADDLAACRDRLELMRAEELSVAAAFDVSYENLGPALQRFFRRLGVHPGVDLDIYAAAALDGIDLTSARRNLEYLYDHYLLTGPQHGRYRMHDLIREHARNLAAAEPEDERIATCGRVLNYYVHTSNGAQRHIFRRSPVNEPPVTGAVPVFAPDLPNRPSAIGWLTAERHNLHAVANYAAANGQPGQVVTIAASLHSVLRRFGHWDQALKLHQLGYEAAREIGSADAQARALTDRGDIEHVTGKYAAAKASLLAALELYHSSGSELGEASALNELGVVQETVGEYSASADSHERALRLYRKLGNQVGEAGALDRLGVVRHTTGDYLAAKTSHEQALRLYRQLGYRLGEAGALNRLGGVQQSLGDYAAAMVSHEQALAQYRNLEYVLGQANALSRLGSAQYNRGDFAAAAVSIGEALSLYRGLEQRIGEAHALNVLGAIQDGTGNYQDAALTHGQALNLYRDLGHPIGEARALAALAVVQQKAGDQAAAAASEAKAAALYDRLGVTGVAELPSRWSQES